MNLSGPLPHLRKLTDMDTLADFTFTPTTKAPEPDLGGLSRIPVDRYTDPAFLKLEDERIWSKTWLLAGASCDVETGRLFVFDNLRESILVTRARGRNRSRFYNVCQHRGNQLKGSSCGNSPYLSCGFHGWQYHLNGAIKTIPEAHDFPQGVPEGSLSLKEIRCEGLGGIHLDIHGPRHRAFTRLFGCCA